MKKFYISVLILVIGTDSLFCHSNQKQSNSNQIATLSSEQAHSEIMIRTNYPDCQIFWDNVEVGQTDLKGIIKIKSVAYGKHLLELKSAETGSWKSFIDISPQLQTIDIPFDVINDWRGNRKLMKGELIIETNVENVKVKIDDVDSSLFVDTSMRLKLSLAYGKHTIIASKDGFWKQEETVDIQKKANSIYIELRKIENNGSDGSNWKIKILIILGIVIIFIFISLIVKRR